MDSRFEREELLIGLEKVNRLAKAKVLLFGDNQEEPQVAVKSVIRIAMR